VLNSLRDNFDNKMKKKVLILVF